MWKATEYAATRRHASFAGDMQVSRKAHGAFPVNQGGTADKRVRPWQKQTSARGFFIPPAEKHRGNPYDFRRYTMRLTRRWRPAGDDENDLLA